MSEPFIHGIGVYVGCADGKIRNVDITKKQATSLLNWLIHKQGGTIKLSAHTLKLFTEQPAPVSKREERDYVPLARQLPECRGDNCAPACPHHCIL